MDTDRDQERFRALRLKLGIRILLEKHFFHRTTSRSAMALLMRKPSSSARRPSLPDTIGVPRFVTHSTKDANSSLSGSSWAGSSLRSITRPIRKETIVPDWLA